MMGTQRLRTPLYCKTRTYPCGNLSRRLVYDCIATYNRDQQRGPTYGEIAAACFLSYWSVRHVLERLVLIGVIKRVPGSRYGTWVIKPLPAEMREAS